MDRDYKVYGIITAQAFNWANSYAKLDNSVVDIDKQVHQLHKNKDSLIGLNQSMELMDGVLIYSDISATHSHSSF